MGGGYTNVIPIPVVDPVTKAIAGALFKPAGAGPFAAVVYMPGCDGVGTPWGMALQKGLADRYTTKGIALLIVDPFTARGEPEGVCAKLDPSTVAKYAGRGALDIHYAVNALKATPGIDPKRLFLQGYSYGAIASLAAVQSKGGPAIEDNVAGVIGFYPYCFDGVDPTVPVLVLTGEKDDIAPAAACQAVKGNSDFEVVVYPGVYHAFAHPADKPADFNGHHFAYDAKAAEDAQGRADAFIAAHMK